jgi:hypothetical protein
MRWYTLEQSSLQVIIGLQQFLMASRGTARVLFRKIRWLMHLPSVYALYRRSRGILWALVLPWVVEHVTILVCTVLTASTIKLFSWSCAPLSVSNVSVGIGCVHLVSTFSANTDYGQTPARYIRRSAPRPYHSCMHTRRTRYLAKNTHPVAPIFRWCMGVSCRLWYVHLLSSQAARSHFTRRLCFPGYLLSRPHWPPCVRRLAVRFSSLIFGMKH